MIQQSINQLLNIGAIGAKLEQAQTADSLKSAEDVTDATAAEYQLVADKDLWDENDQLEYQQGLNKERAKYGKGILGMRRGIQKEQHLAEDIRKGAKTWRDEYRKQAAQQLRTQKTMPVAQATQSFQQTGIQQVQQKEDLHQLLDSLRAHRSISHSTYEQMREALKQRKEDN